MSELCFLACLYKNVENVYCHFDVGVSVTLESFTLKFFSSPEPKALGELIV